MQQITAPTAPAPAGPYSSGIVSGGFLFLAGQGPFNTEGEIVGATFAEQVEQTFANLEAVAAAAGTSMRNAVRIGVYLNDMTDWPEFNEVSQRFLGTPYPARTSIQADLSGFLVEIDAVVAIAGE
ncbi:RidA family protein [Agrococcus baldri]|uniref:Reactive intermediate/imine deaminase n=1 Tax=Agrococcus baldri TaxID=153730 RepID=A0AA87UX89_9MICO|nr:RidA family protein [Agrococcus baldri]GEK80177.1 reactive intermediate/imine deaminase [Agrococcus baldri]